MKLLSYFVSFILFYLFIAITYLNSILNLQHSVLVMTSLNNNCSLETFFIFFTNTRVNFSNVNLVMLDVYYYPFLYVFLFITVLSIIFCLTYNIDELLSFMYYCIIILMAGYTLFFTDSIILFFMAYEMLLVPSFFILYKFAKTRRCVEAAYLMFF